MFHNFYVPAHQRDYLRFFWYNNNDPREKIIQFRACVHIFGNRQSPSAAQHGLRYAINFPIENDCSLEAKQLILSRIYVDDMLAGFPNKEQAIDALKGARHKLGLSF